MWSAVTEHVNDCSIHEACAFRMWKTVFLRITWRYFKKGEEGFSSWHRQLLNSCELLPKRFLGKKKKMIFSHFIEVFFLKLVKG